MEIILTPAADADLKYWSTSGKTLVLKKIRQLLESIIESPFEGIGKPEPLKFNLVGC